MKYEKKKGIFRDKSQDLEKWIGKWTKIQKNVKGSCEQSVWLGLTDLGYSPN